MISSRRRSRAARPLVRARVLQSDGGDISLIGIENDKEVRVRLEGNCVGCSVNQMTLKSGVEMTIKKYAPQIEKVINLA